MAKGQYDAFWLFYEKCLTLLKEGGYHGYIIPDAILARDEVAILRKLLLSKAEITNIAHVGFAFQGSGVSAAVIILRKAKEPLGLNVVSVEEPDETGLFTLKGEVSQKGFLEQDKQAFILDLALGWGSVKQKLFANSFRLGEVAWLSRGEELGKKNLEVTKGRIPKGKVLILAGEDVARYAISEPKHIVDRADITKSESNYESPKVLIVKTGKSLVCGLDLENRYTLQSLYNLHLNPGSPFHYNYILGILNSNLMSLYIQKEVTSYKRLFPQINQNHILALPIRHIDFNKQAEKRLHDDLVALVDRMLELNKKLHTLSEYEAEQKHALEKEIKAIDEKIDNLVYDLYGLTPEERKIVESL